MEPGSSLDLWVEKSGVLGALESGLEGQAQGGLGCWTPDAGPWRTAEAEGGRVATSKRGIWRVDGCRPGLVAVWESISPARICKISRLSCCHSLWPMPGSC